MLTTLITGANRGIGLELARQYARDQWRVIACCRDPGKAPALNGLARESADLISVHRLDVTDAEQRQALVGELHGTSIDVLLNNAGTYGQRGARFGNTDERAWLDAFATNSIAPMKLSEALVDNVASSRGRIIASITSGMGSIADNSSGGHYVYRSSKAALNAVMKSMAVDLEPRGIIAIVLNPGWVKTDMGGPNAQITVEQSAQGIRSLLASLTAADSGKFFNVDGGIFPW
jgi:NAD(P)-dependent dehydrogenase (short-subunit alcohol dehydrogenase family)